MQLLHLFEVNILGAVQLPGIHPLDVDLLIFGIHHKLKNKSYAQCQGVRAHVEPDRLFGGIITLFESNCPL